MDISLILDNYILLAIAFLIPLVLFTAIIFKDDITITINKQTLSKPEYKLIYNGCAFHFIIDIEKEILIILTNDSPSVILKLNDISSCEILTKSLIKFQTEKTFAHQIIITYNDLNKPKLVFNLIIYGVLTRKNSKTYKVISDFSRELCNDINDILKR